jgi:hypothetical protein
LFINYSHTKLVVSTRSLNVKTALKICSHYTDFFGGEACTGFSWGNLRERDHWGDLGADGRIILRWIIRKWDVEVWTGSTLLRIGTGGGQL